MSKKISKVVVPSMRLVGVISLFLVASAAFAQGDQ